MMLGLCAHGNKMKAT